MTTVLETNTAPSIPAAVSAMQDILLTDIQESKTNPRRQFNEIKLAELAENIRQHGVLPSVDIKLKGGHREDGPDVTSFVCEPYGCSSLESLPRKLMRSRSISSRVLPFVSGTRKYTKNNPARQTPA